MRGPHQSAMAVRRPDKSITTETWETFSGGKKWYHSVPIVRGCVSFVESLRVGYRCLMRSADLAGYEEEPSAFEKKLIDKFGKSLRIYKLDDRHFIAKFKAAPQGVIYWTMQYLSQVEIIEPEHMRQKAIEFIKSNPYGITAESERS